ncbi:MAG TPA: hypothetical protein VHB98_07180, partial [Chloroflexota bacterium]|nr:hypothetical protein [Chloroflexota bacterium]
MHPTPRARRYWAVIAVVLALLGPWPAAYAAAPAASGVVVKPSISSGQPLGTTITVTASTTGMKNPVYRFSVAAPNGP